MPLPRVEVEIVALGQDRAKRQIDELRRASRDVRTPMTSQAELSTRAG